MSERLRILRVAQKVFPDVVGGGPYHVHAMSRDQAAMGHDVTVLTVGDGPQREKRDGYTVVRCPSQLSLLGNDIAPGIWRHLKKTNLYDVVHAHSHLYFATNLAALYRRLDKTPLAITNHGLYSQTVPEWLFSAYLRTLGKWTFESSDIVFCYTNEERQRLRRRGVNTSIEVVHNGIDTGQFTPEGPKHDRVVGDPAILFVGRLVKGKRPGDALAAFDRVQELLPAAELQFCGEGPLLTELKQEIHERGLADSVQFLGQVPYDEMPSVYRAADVFLLPSQTEGVPRTVIEAMASGVPVVISDLEQIAPLIKGGGNTVDVGDIEGLAEALVDIVCEGPNDNPRAIVSGTFDWTDTVKRTTAALRRLG